MNGDAKTKAEPFKPIINDLRNEIPREIKERNIPRLAIALVSQKETIWTGCFGHTDLTRAQPANADTLFCLQCMHATTIKEFLTVIWPVVLRAEGFELVDGYCRYDALKRIYAYVGKLQTKSQENVFQSMEQ